MTKLSLYTLLLLALPAAAAPSLSGTYQVSGRDSTGRYRGSATLIQDAQARVTGTLSLEYVRWSWSSFAWTPTGQYAAARIDARVVNDELRGERRADGGLAGLLGGGGPLVRTIRWRIEHANGRIEAVHGSYGSGAERLSRHLAPRDGRERELLRIRAALESATSGLLWRSESDRPYRWVQFDGAAPAVQSAADFRARLRLPVDRPIEERTLEDAFVSRIVHRPDETPEEGALVDRNIALVQLLRARLVNVRAYRIGPTGSTNVTGAVSVWLVGETVSGDLVGLVTQSIET